MLSLNKVVRAYQPAMKTKKRNVLLYGGAGSSKSTFAHQKEVGLLYDRSPRTLFLRKTKDTHRRSCFQLCRDIILSQNWSPFFNVNKSDMTIECGDALAWFVGLDDTEKLKSVTNPTRIVVEEGTELTEGDLYEVDRRGRGVQFEQLTILFNPVLAARRIFRYFGVAEADLPERNHREFDDVYVQHTTWRDARQFIGEEYVKVFRRQGGTQQAIYEFGKLVSDDAPDQLIKWEWLKAAFDRDRESVDDGRQRLGIDPAWTGPDAEVMQRFKGLCLVETIETDFQDMALLASHAIKIITDNGIPAENVGIDAVGVGAGCYNNIAMVYEIQKIISGAAPVEDVPHIPEDIEFNNLRSQMWYFARECFERGLVAIDIPEGEARNRLQEELLAPRFRSVSARKFEVEPKRGTRAWGIDHRLGRSPDYADAFVYGLFAQYVEQSAAVLWAV
tara:strand:+ start:315 stop:1652 length:1338 start_codon:yes stop_codon:yes gene_type:complete